MAGVYLSSHTNSTLFTTCCGTAICDDESKCPHCGEDIPFSPRARWDMGMNGLYGPEKVRKMRQDIQDKMRKERNQK